MRNLRVAFLVVLAFCLAYPVQAQSHRRESNHNNSRNRSRSHQNYGGYRSHGHSYGRSYGHDYRYFGPSDPFAATRAWANSMRNGMARLQYDHDQFICNLRRDRGYGPDDPVIRSRCHDDYMGITDIAPSIEINVQNNQPAEEPEEHSAQVRRPVHQPKPQAWKNELVSRTGHAYRFCVKDVSDPAWILVPPGITTYVNDATPDEKFGAKWVVLPDNCGCNDDNIQEVEDCNPIFQHNAGNNYSLVCGK